MKVIDRVVKSMAMRWVRGKVKDLRRSTNMTTASKVLKFLDGWKLMIGVAVLFGTKVFDSMSNGHSGEPIAAVLGVLGWLPAGGFDMGNITVAAASAVALWGFIARLYKAQRQSAAGASVSQLLSAEGYAIKAKADKKW